MLLLQKIIAVGVFYEEKEKINKNNRAGGFAVRRAERLLGQHRSA